MASGRSQYYQTSASAQNNMDNSDNLPEQRPGHETAAFDRYQHHNEAQYAILQIPNQGFNRARSAPRNQQPLHGSVPSHTAHEQYGFSRQYRPSGRNDGTLNSRAEMTSDGNVPSLYPASVGNGSSTSRIQGMDGRYHSSETPQPSRQQNTYGLKTPYRGAYKNKNNSHTNPVAGYQQSPYLLPGQEPHDVNNPPSAFRSGSAAMMQRNTIAVPNPAPPHKTKTKQRNDSIESFKEDEEPKQETKKDTTKKIQNPPRTKCATLRKVIRKRGETKTANGQVMWLDPNEPAHKKWSKLQPHSELLEHIDPTLTLCRAGSSHG